MVARLSTSSNLHSEIDTNIHPSVLTFASTLVLLTASTRTGVMIRSAMMENNWSTGQLRPTLPYNLKDASSFSLVIETLELI